MTFQSTAHHGLRAIETEYGGYRFRSRTEARWAVWFNETGQTWEYEPEGLILPVVGYYLPDFRVGGVWYEVKAPSVLNQTYAATGGINGVTTGANDAPSGPKPVWAALEKPIMLAVAARADVHVVGGMNPGDLALQLQFYKGDVYPSWWELPDGSALTRARSYRFVGVR